MSNESNMSHELSSIQLDAIVGGVNWGNVASTVRSVSAGVSAGVAAGCGAIAVGVTVGLAVSQAVEVVHDMHEM